MLWERATRFWRGWVMFEGEGAMPEQLIRRARAQGISLWNTRCKNGMLYACCTATDYLRLRAAVRHSGFRVHLRRKHGLPFLLRGYRHRYGLLVGAALAILWLAVVPQYIWVVSVEGNDTVPTERILQAVASQGVVTGTRWNTLDIPTIRMQSLAALPEIAWLTVNPEGSVAHIEVVERGDTPSLDTGNTPSNLIASCDGVIREIRATGGYPQVKVGEAVTAGDLLVSGVYETELYGMLVRSKGTVTAQTEHTVTVDIPLTAPRRTPTGHTRMRSVFRFLRWHVPLYTTAPLSEDWILTEQDYCPVVRGITLPVGYIRRTYTQYRTETVHRTEHEAAQLAQTAFETAFKAQYPAATLLSHTDTATVQNGIYRLVSVCVCEENIAREIPLVVIPK